MGHQLSVIGGQWSRQSRVSRGARHKSVDVAFDAVLSDRSSGNWEPTTHDFFRRNVRFIGLGVRKDAEQQHQKHVSLTKETLTLAGTTFTE